MTESSYEPRDPDLTPEPILRGGFDITTESGARCYLAQRVAARGRRYREAHNDALALITRLGDVPDPLLRGEDAEVVELLVAPWDPSYGDAIPDKYKTIERLRRIAADLLLLAAADETFAHRLEVEAREWISEELKAR